MNRLKAIWAVLFNRRFFLYSNGMYIFKNIYEGQLNSIVNKIHEMKDSKKSDIVILRDERYTIRGGVWCRCYNNDSYFIEIKNLELLNELNAVCPAPVK